jgi:hypothetical protein
MGSDIRAHTFEGGVAVTPSDTATIGPFAALYVGSISGGSAVKVTDLKGNKTTYSGLVAGTYLRVQGTRVWATGTTASGIVMLFATPIGGS